MRLYPALTLVLLIALSATASAAAATPLGSVATTGNAGFCSGCTFLQEESGPGGPSYEVPAGGGVLTSWRTQGNDVGDSTVRLRVIRPVGGGVYQTLADSPDATVPTGTSASHAIRIPVAAHDLLGMRYTGQMKPYDAAAAGNATRQVIGDPTPGNTVNVAGIYTARMNVEATLEPDADGDGYGDETQDACPTDGTTQGACPVPSAQDQCPSEPATDAPCADLVAEMTAAPQSVFRTGKVTYTLTARNTSSSAPANGAGARISFPPDLALDPASFDGAACTAARADGHDVLDCRLPDLAPGASASVTAAAQTSLIGTSHVDGSVSYRAVDPNLANNSASVSSSSTYDPTHRCPGANYLGGGAGADRLTGTRFSDPIYASAGNDLIAAGAGDDCIFAGAGADRVSAGSGNDRVDGGSGNDRISGGPGRDRILGRAGNDTIDASDRARDTVDCGPGHDTVIARPGDKLKRCERIKVKRG